MSLMSPNSVALIPAAVPQRRNRDVFYPFRQDSDFFYLTGFCEPNALLVLVPGRAHGEELLFLADRDERAELYDGERLGPDRAAQVLGMDDAFPYADVADIVPGLLEGKERIYINLGEYPEFDQKLLLWVSAIRKRESGGSQPPGEFVELKHFLHELRLIKSKKEQRLMRRAAEISASAHLRAMRACRPGMNERQLEAELVYEFMRRGAREPAYPSIVAGGANACVLHYADNQTELRDGELCLIDAGCEYEYYAGDITRTFPVNGQFSAEQRALYEVVLDANKAAIAACEPGAHCNAPHERAYAHLAAGLVDLGLLTGAPEDASDTELFKLMCPHKTSHWLGLDVHDVGDYRLDDQWRELEPGMALTIEPGVYIPRNTSTEHLPEAYRGMGIRIEDDVLITADGCEVLSAAVPKEAAEIEAVMRCGATC